MAFSPLCQFAPWLVHPLALPPSDSFALWLIRPLARSPPGLLAPWLIRHPVEYTGIIEACVSIYRKASNKCSITSLIISYLN